MKKNLTLALLASICLVAIPSCGGKTEESKPAAPTEATAPAETTAPVETPAPAEVAASAEAPAPAEATAPVDAPAPAEVAAPAETPAPANASQPSDYVAIAKEMLVCIEKVTAELATVMDKDSADAAATKLPPILADMQKVTLAAQALGEPSVEATAGLDALNAEGEAKVGAMLEKLMPIITNQYYGSEALKNVLEGMK